LGEQEMQFTDAEIENLSIENFIFHVVHHNADEPILLNEAPLNGFEGFFLQRALETLKGNQFIFADGSNTRTLLSQALKDQSAFVPNSKLLAQTFHAARDGRIKPGALILMILQTGNRKVFCIIKYDHELAITYDINDDYVAFLKSIANSFTKSPDALQKSALIELGENDDNIVVVDKFSRKQITDFFRGFLVCKRRYTNYDLTKTIEDVVVEVVKRHKDELPAEITQNSRYRYHQSVLKRDVFESDEFFAEFFGAHGNEKVRKTFNSILKTRDLDGEVFEFDKTAVKSTKPQKYKTAEGVKIEIPEQATDTFHAQNTPEGTTITIKTSKLIIQ
jgi:hypothetical protein